MADNVFRLRFSPLKDGRQTATVRLATGSDVDGDPDSGRVIFRDAPVSLEGTPQESTSGDFRFFAGLRSDPFFADVE